MSWLSKDRWLRLWRAAGAAGDAENWYQPLTQAYAESGRHYHNQQHIAECLAEFDAANHLARNPEAVEFALWFHDAVYNSKAGDNEEQSAVMAKNCLLGAKLPEFAETVATLVMATKFHNTDGAPDAGLVVDVDLSILGQNQARFAEYESQIRQEYLWVPEALFNAKRAEILQGFLERKRIYTNDHFLNRYEQSARRNIAESIRKLTANGHS
jgi:predicted metal-dependent HD superfamily phosphohydrolase